MVEQAIIRALKQRDLEIGDGETLRRIAEAQIERALAGDTLAFDKVADRLDGKAQQGITHSGDPNAPIISRVEQVVVDPRDSSSNAAVSSQPPAGQMPAS